MMDTYSPKNSPHPQSRSPSVAGGSGNPDAGLKVTISLKQKTPFYLARAEQITFNETTGATNLMAARGLEHSYVKLTTKKMKDSLSSFLPNMPGVIDTPGSQDNSSLRGIIEKPPVCGKELHPLNQLQLSGFRLHPGPLPEQYRGLTQVQARRRHKHKKHKHSKSAPGSAGAPVGSDTPRREGEEGAPSSSGRAKEGDEERERRREKKHKKHEKDEDKAKKKKKEKKKKKKDDKD